MITTLHTLSLASITHHTNSPRVRLRRPPRARPQLTRPPLLGRRCPPRCYAAHRSCASPFAWPSSQRAARPSPATRRERDARRPARRRPRARRPTRVWLRLPPLTRPPLSAPVLRRPPRPPELRQSARPPVLVARCPTIASSHAARRASRRERASHHERDARRERGRSSPDRRCLATARRPARRRPRARRPTPVAELRDRRRAPSVHRRRRREGHPCK